MSTRSSTRSRAKRSPRNRFLAALAPLVLVLCACSDPRPAQAQQVVFDPKNHLENALQAARQLESLTNEARMLANEARQLAASPYSHLAETSSTLREIGELARSVRGVASDIEGLQTDFEKIYPTAVDGLDPRRALEQARARNTRARETAQDLARTAAELERLSRGRTGRLEGAINASQRADGQTAAIQSSTQVLAVLAEDLGSMRTLLMAQSRLLAAESAQRAADKAAGAEARKQFWGREGTTIANPDFDPYSPARR
ncbi:conjugal transfer protein TrbJ [uncultured Phenylobacterium sp.]|uniref:conjugal transfer protein TrbJ n=1 Tax=uncultured Phenylobacterium sp. TaxID=349273 RepID=UPI0025D2A3C6|nr:conjugal transfer protein TrbJ [uncultured Phenylobacterium sp.]